METGKLHYVPTSHFWWGFFCNYHESGLVMVSDSEVFNGETWQMYNVCPLKNLRNPMHMVSDEN